jgi:hypothetical protein
MRTVHREANGGADGSRTHDLLNAIQKCIVTRSTYLVSHKTFTLHRH